MLQEGDLTGMTGIKAKIDQQMSDISNNPRLEIFLKS